MTQIKKRFNDLVIYEDSAETIAETLVSAIRAGANLVRANLEGANLDGANLDGANLEGANLDGANLVRANLVRANLDGANLDGANLDGANLVRANLVRANLYGANLEGANLDGANLPIWCKWSVSWSESGEDKTITVKIECKVKKPSEWDLWFESFEEFETNRDTEDFKRIRANYKAVRAYLIEMGLYAP